MYKKKGILYDSRTRHILAQNKKHAIACEYLRNEV